MSSRDSPPLSLDVERRRAERWCAAGLVALTTVAVGLVSLRAPAFGLGLAVVGGAVLGYGVWSVRWFGAHRVSKIAWLADGRWMLADQAGTIVEATLRGDSRVGRQYVWLRWNADVVRSMLLFRGDLTEGDLRRLIVRLRIVGLEDLSHPRHPEKGSDL